MNEEQFGAELSEAVLIELQLRAIAPLVHDAKAALSELDALLKLRWFFARPPCAMASRRLVESIFRLHEDLQRASRKRIDS